MMSSFRVPLALLILAGASLSSAAEGPAPVLESPVSNQAPDATITVSGGVIALGVGYEWGHGTLNYQGKSYSFHVRGMSVLDLGAAKFIGAGEVYNLKFLGDFAGNYAGTTVGSAVAEGGSLALLKNEHGVTIRARSKISGLRLNFSGNGMKITLDEPSSARPAAR